MEDVHVCHIVAHVIICSIFQTFVLANVTEHLLLTGLPAASTQVVYFVYFLQDMKNEEIRAISYQLFKETFIQPFLFLY